LAPQSLIGLLLQLRMIDDECGAVGGMRTSRVNRYTRRKPTPAPLCRPQIPNDLTWDRTRAVAVGSQRLTVSAMARPYLTLNKKKVISSDHDKWDTLPISAPSMQSRGPPVYCYVYLPHPCRTEDLLSMPSQSWALTKYVCGRSIHPPVHTSCI
jgi:hypothetical protein